MRFDEMQTWKREKEIAKAREKVIALREKQAAKDQKMMRREKIVEDGKVNDFKRVLQNARTEVLQEKALIKEKKDSEKVCWDKKWTQKLAEEVSRLKSEEISEQKRRQLLRSTSVELRQLEEQLRSAYAAKTNDTSEQENFVQDREKKERYRRDLQDQLTINYRKRQEKSKEKERERERAEEISQVLRKEEMEKSRQKKEMAVRLRAEEEAFLRAKEIRKCKEKEALMDESNRIKRITSERENQKRRSSDTEAENLANKERMLEKMAVRMLDEEMKKREREDIINTAYEEEEKSSMQAKLRNESLEKQRQAKDLLEDMLRQKKAIVELKVQNSADDNAFAQYIAEQNQIAINREQEKDQTRRRLGICYGEDLKAAIMNKKILHDEELLRRQESICNDEKAEAVRRQQISQERLMILQEHATRLQGFLKVKGTTLKNFEKSLS
ncbi:meiosis-specific nuclear structural protein 1-like isoform X2 [Belonocnema kinseyi]|uniref:meiosis-specific nuclear structural protein 1-like isoform X2 n=1 Tax=Belonocnema kinseyi TaxID=2817044 RepID=UPI00143DBDC0|nr:meiosis-specific nuclear structural protein 1-like isoform X2 [Belonocnema kinseyi]